MKKQTTKVVNNTKYATNPGVIKFFSKIIKSIEYIWYFN